MADAESWIGVNSAPIIFEPHNLYELSWTYAPGSMFALDCDTGELIDANPAAEALSGYSRDELIGRSLTDLHPEAERDRVRVEIRNAVQTPLHLRSGFHFLREDGQCPPVEITSSRSLLLDGRQVLVLVYFNITKQVDREHQLSVKNWALSAFSTAALALGRAQSAEGLLQSICEAVTRESAYLLAWIGMKSFSLFTVSLLISEYLDFNNQNIAVTYGQTDLTNPRNSKQLKQNFNKDNGRRFASDGPS